MQMVPGGSPILHQVALEVPESYFTDGEKRPILFDIVDQMRQMLAGQNGVGLAAPQVDVSSRIFLIDYGNQETVCINPEITKWSGKTDVQVEGCLSYPGVRVPIERDTRIKVTYRDLVGAKKSHYMSGMKARIFQHELDHLNGITIDKRTTDGT